MRTSARMTGAAAAAAAVALLLSGCGSSDDGGDEKDKKPEATPTAERSPAPEGDGAGGAAALPGVWQTKVGGKDLVLTVVGEAASLLRDKKMCSGHVMKSGGKGSLMLKCPGGTGEDRTNGEIGAVTAKTMKVTWNGGSTDTFMKAAEAPAKLPKDPGQLPDGLKDKLKELPGS